MKLYNQIYRIARQGKVFVALYLITTVLALSVLVNAASLTYRLFNFGNIKVFSDSLKQSQSLAPLDSLHSLKVDSISLLLKGDSLHLKDSIFANRLDSLHKKTDTLNAGDSEIQDIITYKAKDSIVYDLNSKKMYLYDTADVKYQKIKLDADLVEFDWNTFTLTANGVADSADHLRGTPIFTEDGKDYTAKKMAYNFKTKKGKIYEVVTKEGEAYIHSAEVKRNEYEEWYGHSSAYTTCDLDHPHFYFKAKKVKIIPDKVMVTGPANLWIADVPTPIYLPFGIFPVKQGQRSGIILPEYGQDAILGFFLRNGGYYWAVNDYLGIKLTGQISTNGTWGLNLASQYALRYRFNGAFSFSILRSAPADPDLPGAKATNAYSISWTHTEDPRSLPNSTFGASVQMQSADYYTASRVTDQRLLNTSFNSSIDFSHNFVGTPFSLMLNLRHNQNLENGTIDFTLPTVRLSMSRYTPFKNKIQSEKPKWYESIGIAYSFEFQNQLNTYDSILFQPQSISRFSMGADQNLTLDAPIKVFKYFTLTPSFQYQERTYFRSTSEQWDPDTVFSIQPGGGVDSIYGRVKSDTSWKINSAHDFTASLTFGTKVTGIFKFKNKYIKAIKHVFTPSVSFAYHPDFGAPFWGYYHNVQVDSKGDIGSYQVFDPNPIYGVPAMGKEGAVMWSLGNNFEMKTYSKTDSIKHEKTMGLLDQVNLTGGYNFAADSLRLLPFNLSVVSARLFNLINLQFNAIFDPYATDSANNDVNVFEWTEYHRLLRFSQANVSASLTLHSKVKPTLAPTQEAPPKFIGDYVTYNPDQIYNFDIPWNFTINYHFNVTHGTFNNPDTILTIQTISIQADFNLTSHWKIAFSTGFDITHRQVTLTNLSVVRDLHCWELSFNWTPALPTFTSQQFSIILHPKSPTLQDLKVQKKNTLEPL